MKVNFKLVVLLLAMSFNSFAQESDSEFNHQLRLSGGVGSGIWEDHQTSDSTMQTLSQLWQADYHLNFHQRQNWSIGLALQSGPMFPEGMRDLDQGFVRFQFRTAYTFTLIQNEDSRFDLGLQYRAQSRLISNVLDENQNKDLVQHFSRQGLSLQIGAQYHMDKWRFEGQALFPMATTVNRGTKGDTNLNEDLFEQIFKGSEWGTWHQYFAADLSLVAAYEFNEQFDIYLRYQAEMQAMPVSPELFSAQQHLSLGVNLKF
ncbi:hypothetical protein [Croceimicrobium sp.]|uniref:hypothetical protein n=1 Tax=Croceimicrobium sp. TaxID=2828340 RepID=UPI003BABD78B